MRLLVIGLGRAERGDDAVGLVVAQRLAPRLGGVPAEVSVVLGADPADLIELWDGAGVTIVIDAVRSGRAAGGIVVRDVTAQPLPVGSWSVGGSHALDLAAAVELARALGRLPQRLVVIGVEVQQVRAGAGLSAAVEAAVGPAVEAAVHIVDIVAEVSGPAGAVGGRT
jgi:hydrogenase maturation protease